MACLCSKPSLWISAVVNKDVLQTCYVLCFVKWDLFSCCLGRQNRCINSHLALRGGHPWSTPGLPHLWVHIKMTPDWSLMVPGSFLRFQVSSLSRQLWLDLECVVSALPSESLQTLFHRAWGSAACTCRESGSCLPSCYARAYLQMRMYVFLIYTDQKIIFLVSVTK